MISGYLLTLSSFGWPLVIGGAIKAVYDILLLIKFQKCARPKRPRRWRLGLADIRPLGAPARRS